MEYSQENNKRICKSYAEKIERCVGNIFVIIKW